MGGVGNVSYARTKDLYQVQEALKLLCEFSTVWADQADLGSTETAKQKLKYATFEDSFFTFCRSKKVLFFKCFRIRT